MESVSRETAGVVKEALERLRSQTLAWGIDLDPSQIRLLSDYVGLLAEYKLANVIGTKDRERIVLEHLTDALSCFAVEDVRHQRSVVDVGTGAGLPGIPLAIARSDLYVLLLETTKKKVRFLEHARATLALRNTEVLHARAEDVASQSRYREAFDLATARALAVLPVVLEYCAPLVREGGAVLAMKSLLPEKELATGMRASEKLGLALREIQHVNYNVGLPQKERRIAVFDKVKMTPTKFPRKVGLAKKQPLGA